MKLLEAAVGEEHRDVYRCGACGAVFEYQAGEWQQPPGSPVRGARFLAVCGASGGRLRPKFCPECGKRA